VVTDIHDTITLNEKKYRTNLRNAELSKRTFRIFLEKQILSHMKIEIQKNIHEAQTPLTPIFDDNKSDSLLNPIGLMLPSSQVIPEKKSSFKNDLTLSNLKTDMPSGKATNSHVIVNYDINSGNVCGNLFRSKSKSTTYAISISNQNISHPKINKVFNKESNLTLIHDNGPEWFQNNETVSIHGSLLSETISDASIDMRNINHKRCRWRRIFFCCVN